MPHHIGLCFGPESRTSSGEGYEFSKDSSGLKQTQDDVAVTVESKKSLVLTGQLMDFHHLRDFGMIRLDICYFLGQSICQ
ncbi:uncharacterized protein LOC142521754 isoform X3 [Primulina tabacum]|uniref:uncharacterized protein LOC142521754 isoform X3 n=1 Tax=Primulina tabacum TaxID=48773 RepID=UPI003F5A2AFB